MTRKFPAASKLAMLLAAAALVALGSASASAQSKQKYDKDGRPYYGANGPNRSYQQGPRTRVYVTTRSWLDAGTEVLPGDRKFQDYAFPPEIGYPTFARENLNRPIDRQPLNPPSDMGGYPQRIPAVLSAQSFDEKCPALDRAFFMSVQPSDRSCEEARSAVSNAMWPGVVPVHPSRRAKTRSSG